MKPTELHNLVAARVIDSILSMGSGIKVKANAALPSAMAP